MKLLLHLPLKWKLSVITVFTSGVALLLACATFAFFAHRTFRERLELDLAIITEIFESNVVTGLISDNPESVTEILNSLVEDDRVIRAAVFDADGRLFSQYQREGTQDSRHTFVLPSSGEESLEIKDGRLEFFERVRAGADPIGWIYLSADTSLLRALVGQYIRIIGALLVFCTLFALLLTSWLQRIISEPIRQLASTMDSVAHGGDFGIRAVKHGRDEVGRLVDGFNNMLAQIQIRDDAVRSVQDNLEKRVDQRTADLAHERDQLRSLLDSSPDSIYFKDRDSRFVLLSRSKIEKMLARVPSLRDRLLGPGADPAAPVDSKYFVGLSDADTYVGDDAAAARADEEEMMRTGEPVIGKLEQVTYLDGTVSWSLINKMPWRDQSGRIIGTFGMSKDVTALKLAEAKLQTEIEERRRMAEELKTSDAFLHSLLANLPVSVYRKDVAGRFTFANEQFCRTLHRSLDDILGRDDFAFSPAELATKYRQDDQTIMESRKPMHTVEPHPLSATETGWVEVIKVAVVDRDGQLVGTQGMFWDVTERKRAEAKVEQLHRELLLASRQAGMAEVATGVLHNVGNVLNSVNVSATLVSEQLRDSKVPYVARVSALLQEHADDLGTFLGTDPKGRKIPSYLRALGEDLVRERQTMTEELELLRKHIGHIKDIVSMQQSYAKVSGVAETVPVQELVEDAFRLNATALARHEIEIIRDFRSQPVLTVDRHKILQILVNLIRNAKHACDDSGRADKKMTVRIAEHDGHVQITVIDNGVGIPPENFTRIFNHGFTTRKNGHGFGLHSGALAARELGGTLSATSEGPGLGAAFTLDLPLHSKPASA